MNNKSVLLFSLLLVSAFCYAQKKIQLSDSPGIDTLFLYNKKDIPLVDTVDIMHHYSDKRSYFIKGKNMELACHSTDGSSLIKDTITLRNNFQKLEMKFDLDFQVPTEFSIVSKNDNKIVYQAQFAYPILNFIPDTAEKEIHFINKKAEKTFSFNNPGLEPLIVLLSTDRGNEVQLSPSSVSVLPGDTIDAIINFILKNDNIEKLDDIKIEFSNYHFPENNKDTLTLKAVLVNNEIGVNTLIVRGLWVAIGISLICIILLLIYIRKIKKTPLFEKEAYTTDKEKERLVKDFLTNVFTSLSQSHVIEDKIIILFIQKINEITEKNEKLKKTFKEIEKKAKQISEKAGMRVSPEEIIEQSLALYNRLYFLEDDKLECLKQLVTENDWDKLIQGLKEKLDKSEKYEEFIKYKEGKEKEFGYYTDPNDLCKIVIDSIILHRGLHQLEDVLKEQISTNAIINEVKGLAYDAENYKKLKKSYDVLEETKKELEAEKQQWLEKESRLKIVEKENEELKEKLENPDPGVLYSLYLKNLAKVLDDIRNLKWKSEQKDLFFRLLPGDESDKLNEYINAIESKKTLPETLPDEDINNFIELFTEIFRLYSFFKIEPLHHELEEKGFPYSHFEAQLMGLRSFWITYWNMEVIVPDLFKEKLDSNKHNDVSINKTPVILSKHLFNFPYGIEQGVIREFDKIGLIKGDKIIEADVFIQ